MKWSEVRDKNPDKWVLFEALEAHSENGKREVDDISILNTFDDSGAYLLCFYNFWFFWGNYKFGNNQHKL